MAVAATTIAYESVSRQADEPRRDWLEHRPAELARIGAERVPFWLTLFVVPAFNLDGKRAVFRLPSRDYPFAIHGASTDIELSAIRLFTTLDQLSADDLPLTAITGGNFRDRRRFRWQTPLTLLPHQAWRAEIVFKTPLNALGLHVNFEGVKLIERQTA